VGLPGCAKIVLALYSLNEELRSLKKAPATQCSRSSPLEVSRISWLNCLLGVGFGEGKGHIGIYPVGKRSGLRGILGLMLQTVPVRGGAGQIRKTEILRERQAVDVSPCRQRVRGY